MAPEEKDGAGSRCYVHADEVPWGDYSAYYPDKLMQSLRAKRLIGPGGALPGEEMLLGLLELDPGASYPLHQHAPPEIYYVIQGKADCLFGEERFEARSGTVIHTKPNLPHSFQNIGEDKFIALGFWWAPGGDASVLRGNLVLLDRDGLD